jgi:hypothetical protein
MARATRELVKHTFRGPRFDDHGLDLSVLSELVAYKEILVETAKELWRRHNPNRERLPANYEESLVLKFFGLEKGSSTCVPIHRELEDPEQGRLFEEPDELDEAARLVANVIRAAGQDASLPSEFPARILQRFETYGRSLRDDESIVQSVAKGNGDATYNRTVRGRLMERSEGAYEDQVDLIGTVTMARVSLPRMTLTLDDGRDIDAVFRAEDEDAVTTALKRHASVKVRIKGRGLFLATGALHRVAEITELSLLEGDEQAMAQQGPRIWEVFDEILRDTPQEQLDLLPRDGARQHDHYIYGTPKQQ